MSSSTRVPLFVSPRLTTLAGQFLGRARLVLASVLLSISTAASPQFAPRLEGPRTNCFELPVELYEAGPNPHTIVSGDLDGDRTPEIVALGDSREIFVAWNQGDGSFDPPRVLLSADYEIRPRIHVIDVNGDGWNDVVVGVPGVLTAGVAVSFNKGGGIFGELQPQPTGPAIVRALADIDGDGFDDVCLGSGDEYHESWITVFRNVAGQSLALSEEHPRDQPSVQILTPDFDGDGRNDLAVSGGDSVTFFLKDCR